MLEALLALLLGWVAAVQPASMDEPVRHTFPVAGEVDYGHAHHDYPATDIWAACGARVRSPVDGVVLEVGRRDRWRPATDLGRDRGGRFVSVRGDDGVRYYGSHLRGVRAGVTAGDRVRAGTLLGWVGRSGNARFVGCQLHFGISPLCHGTHDWDVRRGTLSPYPFLRSWQRGGDRSPRHAVQVWRARHGCPARAPAGP